MSGLFWEQAPRPPSGWQGIDRLELREVGGLPELTVRLYGSAASIGAGHIRIDGAPPWDLLVDPPQQRRLRIRFREIGDHARYQLQLTHGGTLPLHPFFDRRDFRFRINCESADCAAPPSSAPLPTASDPSLDTLARDARALEALLLERLQRISPDVGDLSLATTERMLIQLLAVEGDMLAYYQDRVAAEAFVETATQRHALRQHALLLGETLDDGATATTLLEVEVGQDGILPAGLPLFSKVQSPGQSRTVFTTQHDAPLWKDRLKLAAWPSATGAVLPASSQEALLFGHPAIAVGQRLAFVLAEGTHLVTVTSVLTQRAPGWVATPTDPLSTALAAVTRIRWEPPLPRAISPWREPFRLVRNLVEAEHGEWRRLHVNPALLPPVPDETLRIDSPDLILQQPSWSSQLLIRALHLHGPMLHSRSGPILEVDGKPWQMVEHLHSSTSFDPHFVVEKTESRGAWLRMGDGRQGQAVRADARLVVRWQEGEPLAGNCPAQTLLEWGKPPELAGRLDALQIRSLRNLIPGSGGRLPLPRAAVAHRLVDSIREPLRLRTVALADLATAAGAVPGVLRAVARPVSAPFPSIQILIDPRDLEAGPEVEAAVVAHLEPLRLAGRELWVRRTRNVPLELVLELCPVEGEPVPGLLRRVEQALVGPSGHFDPEHLAPGEALQLGDLLARVQSVAGLRACKARVFRRLGTSDPPVQWTLSVGSTERLRLDGDPLHPENGRLQLLIAEHP